MVGWPALPGFDAVSKRPAGKRLFATKESEVTMKRLFFTLLILATTSLGQALASQTLIVRDNNGLLAMQGVCQLLGCSVIRQLDGMLGKLFLVGTPDLISLEQF